MNDHQRNSSWRSLLADRLPRSVSRACRPKTAFSLLVISLTAPTWSNATAADRAQGFPSKPIRFIVPFSAGAQTDILARILGQTLADAWGHPVVTENRPSAGGTIASGIVATSSPDGHTMMMVSPSHAVNATLYSKLPYDTLRDFHGVCQVATVPVTLVVSAATGVKSVKELVALAKQQPGKINFGSSGIGSSTHLRGEQLRFVTGIDVTHIPYKGPPEALANTVAGRIQFLFSPFSSTLPFYRQGRVTVIAISGEQRSTLMPDVATFAESGFPDLNNDGWYGLVVQGRTPKPIMERIAADVARTLRAPDIVRSLEAQGAAPKWLGPDGFQALIRVEVERIGKVIKASGARAD